MGSEEDMDPVVDLSLRLAEVAVKNTAQVIYDKMSMYKQTKNDTERINALSEIINDLISDKNELIQISQTFAQELSMNKISEEECQFITSKIHEILDMVPHKMAPSQLDSIEKLISPETLQIMQLLGFNYRKGIGEPLTELAANYIQSKAPKVVGDQKGRRN